MADHHGSQEEEKPQDLDPCPVLNPGAGRLAAIMKAFFVRAWPLLAGFALALLFAYLDALSWHESHSWPDRIAIKSFGLAGPFMALFFTQDISLLVSIPWIILHSALMVSHAVWPRWYTAILSIGGMLAWFTVGETVAGIAC